MCLKVSVRKKSSNSFISSKDQYIWWLSDVSEGVILSRTSSRREPADRLKVCNSNIHWLSVLIFVVKGRWSEVFSTIKISNEFEEVNRGY